MNFWWANQKQTHRHEIGNGYLWSPKRQANNNPHFSYEYMKHIQPGDIIFSYAFTQIIAVGIAKTHCYTFPKPTEFGTAGDYWSNEGWKVEVRYRLLSQPVSPSSHLSILQPLLAKKYSPISPAGRGNQAYLFQIDKTLALALAHLIDVQTVELICGNYLSEHFDEADTVNVHIEEWEDKIQRRIDSDNSINDTEKDALIKARRGQGKFRELLLTRELHCRVTGVNKPEHLIASHIKPWRSATNAERLDPENGFMLTPTIDHLFDKGFISFENNGAILLADVADRDAMERMGVIGKDATKNIGSLRAHQKGYLQWHRESILLR